jgi:hypothetical protein
MARNDKFQRMKLLRGVALSVLLGEETAPYEPNQFKNLSVDVADVLSKRDGAEKPSWVSVGATYASLSDDDEEFLREVLADLQREGVLIEGLNPDNPRWPFFRLSSRAGEILAAQKALAVAPSHVPFIPASESKPGQPGHSKHQEVTSMAEQPTGEAPPKVFISYSWDDEGHKQWVREFAARLRGDGVEAIIDQWEVVPGDRLPLFMEKAIRENSYVLIVCTPKYKEKSDNRKGGVGYEGDIMTAEVYAGANHRKFIPVLRGGSWSTAIPSWLGGKYSIDLSHTPYSDDQYRDLLATLHNMRDQAPPVGPAPRRPSPPEPIREAVKKFLPTQEGVSKEFEPIKIVGVLADEVGEPLNDGTRGSALYAVPFKLNRSPSTEWSELFVRTWDRPPSWTTSHRPGIAQVQGDRVVLTRTTLEEVQKTHRDTLKLVVDAVNKEIAELVRRRRAAEQAKTEQSQQHKENVRRIADDIKFD